MTHNVAKSGLEFFMFFFPSTYMSVMKHLSFCFLILLSLLVPPRSRWRVLGFAFPHPPCPEHPPPPQAARFLAQIAARF